MEKTIKNFDQFKKELVSDGALQSKFKETYGNAIRQFQQSAGKTDPWIYRIALPALNFTVLGIIFGKSIPILNAKITNDRKIHSLFTAIGAFAGQASLPRNYYS
jgi:hypothetical protein